MKRVIAPLFWLTLAPALLGLQQPYRAEPVVVHEWGTITTRHTPVGAPVGKLNRIEQSEVLPPFVHRFEPPATRGKPEKETGKGVLTPGRPDVTMRLETPVLYFYPPAGSGPLPRFDVSVKFRGGIVNEFYPDGNASVAVDADRINAKMDAGVVKTWWDGGLLDNYVVGSLRWDGLTLNDSARLPSTSSPIWLAPRRVRSTNVVARSGEAERYLFYRGVAHLDALMRTEVTASEVYLRAPSRLLWLRQPSMSVRDVWLVDVRPDGKVAFFENGGLDIANDTARDLARIPRFREKDYSTVNLDSLRASMKRTLVFAGLFADEAEAMLETWKESYFQKPGLRLFYIVPKDWIDYFLPLQISAPHQLTRVLVGRIDLLDR
jgi:hypothetical protein